MKKINLDAQALKQLIDTSPVAMFAVDKNRNMIFANKGYSLMFGYTPQEVMGVNVRKFHVDDKHYEEFAKKAFNLVTKNIPVEIDYPAKKKDGTVFWVHIVGSYIEEQEVVLWTMIDITQRKEAEDRLEKTNFNFNEYLKAIDDSEIGIFVVDENYKVRYMNNTMIKWFGNKQGQICYSSVVNLKEPCSYCKIHEVIDEHRKVLYEPTTPDGQCFKIIATPIKNYDGTISKMEIIQNITEQKKAQEKLQKQQEQLYYQAHHDALTSLPNRVLFYDRLEHAIKKAKRKQSKIALFFIDLDHFKEINDSLGHDMGDKVLIEATKKLKSIIREEDTLARLGGDEFTIIIEDVAKEQDISILASKIIENLAKPINIGKQELYISSSIGISIYPDNGDNVADLLKYADSAMYRAKDEGRNNFQFYSSDMTELAFERVVMQTSLAVALKNKELVVYYQPQIDAKNNRFIGSEALVRWLHPNMGIVPPSKFIHLAESTGLIVELDRYVMDIAMGDFYKLYKKGLNPGRLSLNLSTKQLKQKDFFEFLQYSITKNDFKPEWLELEVTESQIMHNPKEAIEILEKINKLGIKLSVDDFGTGYSSLSYLKKLPIHKLKIDQSFVRELPHDKESSAIAKAIIALSKSLDLELIAEGVENEAQKEFMVQNGCNNIQGYLFSRPIPYDELEIFIKNRYTCK